MSDRHEQWVRVEPGHIIPAGQPYRIEFPEMLPECLASDDSGILAVDYDGLNGPFKPFHRPEFVETSRWFVDSSWRPPLNLPTEPTWGIALYYDDWHTALWTVEGDRLGDCRAEGTVYSPIKTSEVTDFIPLTDEQVARIEAAR